MNSVETAREQVTRHRGRYKEIARAVGVSVKWVNKFAQGKLEEPGALKFQRLEKWLAQQRNGA